MAADVIPPPPEGFTLDSGSGSIPPPPEGFTVDAPPSKAAALATAPLSFADATLSLGSGAVAAPVAGLSGMAAAFAKALGITDTEAADVVRKVQEHLTYQPQTTGGQALVGAVSAPFEKLANVGDAAGQKVTDVTGSPALGALTNTAIQAAPMVVGKVMPKVAGVIGKAQDRVGAAADDTAALDQSRLQGLKDAHDAGYVTTPEQAKGGIFSTSVEGLAGSPKLQKGASVKNQAVTNKLVREDNNLPADQPITHAALEDIRDKAGAKYEAVKKFGEFDNDTQYFDDLDKIEKPYKDAASSYPGDEVPFQKTIDGLRQDSVDSASAVAKVKLLRKQADKFFRNGDKELGGAYRDMAQAIDNSMDRALTRASETSDMSGDPAVARMVSEYRAARTVIAKSYLADAALNNETGNIDASVYARALDKAPGKLTGPGLQVARFATQFPKLAQAAEKLGVTGMDFGDLILAGLKGATGTGAVGATAATAGLPAAATVAGALLARPATRAALLSRPVQSALVKPPSRESATLNALRAAADAQSLPQVTAAETATGENERRLREIRRMLPQ